MATVISPHPRLNYLRALFTLPWSELNALYARHTCFQTIGRRLAEVMLLEREARAHELLTLTASERYARFLETHREILSELRDYDIASYLGISPVSLSRLRARKAASRLSTSPRRNGGQDDVTPTESFGAYD